MQDNVRGIKRRRLGVVYMTEFLIINAGDRERIAALSEFASGIVKRHFDPIIGVAQNDYMIAKFQSPSAIREQISAGSYYYEVRLGGTLAGFLAFYPEQGKMCLSKFYVAEPFRGKGIASEMFRFLKQKTQEAGISTIFLHVNRHNEGPVAVYRHFGFRVAEEKKSDIGNGFVMDDYIMEWQVEENT